MKKNQKKSRIESQKRVLEGYRQRGKRFVPPFLEYVNLVETNWKDDILPELIWIALSITKFGKKRGVELCLELANAASDCSDDAPGGFSFISEYAQLPPIQRKCVADRLNDSGSIKYLVDVLQVLPYYYPGCPLAFLWETQELPEQNEQSLPILKRLIGELVNRRDVEATIVQATAVYLNLLTGKLKIFRGSGLDNFTEIEAYPNTEESIKVASLVRATINGLLARLELSKDWCNYFWDSGLRLESCEGIENE